MYYKPELADGKFVRLLWPLYLYRLLNLVCWPVEDNAGLVAKIFDRVYYCVGLLIVYFHAHGEVYYLNANWNNIDELLTGMPTFLILLETTFRGFQIGLRKEKLKVLLKEFYAEIYITHSERPEQYRAIQRKLRPTSVMSVLYILTLGLYFVTAGVNAMSNRREPIFKMSFPFDYTPLYIFYPIVVLNLWIGIYVVSFLNGELNMISHILLNLNGRFGMLREDLDNCAHRLLQQADAADIAHEYQRELKLVIRKNVELYKFAAKVQAEFSYRIFVWFAFSATLLCVLGFKVFTNPSESYVFACWCMGKILELSVIGLIGSTLIQTTNEVSSMYYHSKWELIIERSSNTRENVRLMKLILVAMETSHKPISLTGLNFFAISLSSVIKILQGAGSYFTCLISLR